ncbi:MAG TPA: hypothetical protein VEC14_17565, partial [Reyranellaceae bacterium]|nr:hypothetical protein [Reyranellaceae bacterium]
MSPSRILSLAAICAVVASEAGAQITPAANVSAFNPYTSGGWGRTGQPRNYPDGPVVIVPDATFAAPPAQGLAFNPWRRSVQPPASITPYGTYVDPDMTANLPPPPSGPIRSRLLAVPQRGDGPRATPTVARAPVPRTNGVVNVAATPPIVAASRPTVAAAPPPPRVAAAPPRVAAAPPPPVA